MALGNYSLIATAIGFIAWGVWWFLRHNDELPVAIAIFNFLFARRIMTVEEQITDWVSYDPGIGFSYFGFPNVAATYMLLGGVVLVAAYCIKYRFPRIQIDDEESLEAFLESQGKMIFVLFAAFVIINGIIAINYADSPEAILEQSYAYLFTLASSAFIILITVLILQAKRGSLGQKIMLLAVIAVIAFFTVSPSLRFAVIGWVVALIIILTRHYRPGPRLALLSVGIVVVAITFSMLGAMRVERAPYEDIGDFVDRGIDNLKTGNDLNMVDGFVMLMQIYPDILDYGLGREHLEILTRPIPRAIWPDKPPGGWAQKFAAATGQPFFSTGISPSLYGSFYGEGGVFGIVLFSFAYGWLFAKYVNWANRHGSSLRWVLRGVFLASLVPLMRGGDIPGIAAFIGMSYWPLALFVWRYRVSLRRRDKLASSVHPQVMGGRPPRAREEAPY